MEVEAKKRAMDLRTDHSLVPQNHIFVAPWSNNKNEIIVDFEDASVSSDRAVLRENLVREWDICLKRNTTKRTVVISNPSLKVSDLCAIVLQSIAKAKANQCILKEFLELFLTKTTELGVVAVAVPGDENFRRISNFVEADNPFCGKMWDEFQLVLRNYEEMNEHLQRRRSARRTCRSARKILRASAVLTVAGCASLVLIPLAGALTLLTALVAGPLAITIPSQALSVYRIILRPVRRKRVNTRWRQLNSAARGTFVVKHSLQTMNLFVTRLKNEIEYSKNQLRFFLEHTDDDQIVRDIWEQLQRNQETFTLLLNDLEESIISEWA
ncbi:hypothetical protein O6H91_22G013100 [Diphasiastrum complanatum]|uniref:Uncharacterized protein n=1 Tax=Diphasiastrum complanatum TaxID=34168 RepID=A0ACC2AD38_DIPCM|nr:hypothetical protein O6H91_22G013100 [Diphasiastrum complanatum]